ncbi:MAG: HAMP domain-containing histidine kinase [Clostridia bacterium]|nr:HAMP domain-containing histidine kinase [Clostridia bacterium]
MKLRNSLAFRLFISMTLIMILANVISGGWYLIVSLRAGFVPKIMFAFFSTPLHFLVLSMVIGVILIALLARMMIRPIRELVHATKQVAKGDFTVRVETGEADDEVAELVGSFNDMTKELGNNEIFKKDFINSFSHEFKTPIVSIRGFAKQLQRDDISEEQRSEYVDIIVRESERLANMSTNVLLLTRLENQQIMPDISEFSLDEQIRQAILLLEKQWSDKELELDLDLTYLNIRANEEMLSHVWINIIGNAIKFSEQGGRLGVSCRMVGDKVQVAVEDNGIGMDEETCRRIFDKFYQGDVSSAGLHSHATEGNGLGLSLVKRIVELSNGSITVKSSPGNGSTFIVELPTGMM